MDTRNEQSLVPFLSTRFLIVGSDLVVTRVFHGPNRIYRHMKVEVGFVFMLCHVYPTSPSNVDAFTPVLSRRVDGQSRSSSTFVTLTSVEGQDAKVVLENSSLRLFQPYTAKETRLRRMRDRDVVFVRWKFMWHPRGWRRDADSSGSDSRI